MTFILTDLLTMPFVYILTNKTNQVLYVGVTNDLTRRLFEYQQKVQDGFSKRYNLCKLVYCEPSDSMVDALRREKQLKRWHRNWKRNLITEHNPTWKDLLAS